MARRDVSAAGRRDRSLSTPDAAGLDRVASRYARKPAVSELAIRVEQRASGFTWAYGDTTRAYFVASITKLFTTALIMQLRQEKALTLDTPAADIVGARVMSGLSVHGGRDYGPEVTIRELLSHTAGIPDHYDQKLPGGRTLLDEARAGDRDWSFDDLIERTRQMPSPGFAPSTPGRAVYSDTNFQLLGRIIESVASRSYAEELQSRIIEPLALHDTWLFTSHNLDRYDEAAPVMLGQERLRIPRMLASGPSDGGVVSTADDQVRFLRAFVSGRLFPPPYLNEMASRWNSIFSPVDPLSYGMGIMRLRLPRWQSPLNPVPEMIGHSGSLGTVLYHVPQRDIFIAATVNQMKPRSLVHRLIIQLVAASRSRTTAARS